MNNEKIFKSMKKKFYILIIFAFTSNVAISQMYKANSGMVRFFSEATIENIEATSKRVSSILNTKTKQIVFQIPITGFDFDKDLMKEHFNENYLESEKYPKGTFSGKIIEDIDYTEDGKYTATAKGTLKIHGIEKERTIKGTITIKDGVISLLGKFYVVLQDHKVKIPKILFSNIAEKVEVTIKVTYKPYVKK
ncbi:MAG: hypothetical protein COB85_03315 [Bacteroidetes bacterium]|nr:MAG: hypothetical protein COB85_03315 [Bacteroidota bacterium]